MADVDQGQMLEGLEIMGPCEGPRPPVLEEGEGGLPSLLHEDLVQGVRESGLEEVWDSSEDAVFGGQELGPRPKFIEPPLEVPLHADVGAIQLIKGPNLGWAALARMHNRRIGLHAPKYPMGA